jgi:hypothetical protein
MRDKESMGAVNEGTLQCESIQRLNGRGEGSCVKGKEMIKVCYGCWLMGGRGGPRLVYYFILFFSFLNRTGSVRFGLAGSGTPKPETKPNRTFS